MEDLQEFLTMCGDDEPTYMMCCLFLGSKQGNKATHCEAATLWGQVQYHQGILAEQRLSPDVKITEAYNQGYRDASKKAIEIITKGL